MVMAIYMAYENDPNGSTSSKIHPNTCRAKEKKNFFRRKSLQEPCPLWDQSLAEKVIEKYFFSLFHAFHVYFLCLFFIIRSVISCQGGIF